MVVYPKFELLKMIMRIPDDYFRRRNVHKYYRNGLQKYVIERAIASNIIEKLNSTLASKF